MNSFVFSLFSREKMVSQELREILASREKG